MFQSTRPHGARQILVVGYGLIMSFQSTRPHGARPLRVVLLPFMEGFNPRARMGRDL